MTHMTVNSLQFKMIKNPASSKLKVPFRHERTVSSSLQKSKHKKMEIKSGIAKKTVLNIKEKGKSGQQKPKIIAIAQQKTEPVKNRRKKEVKQQPEFLKEFEQITQIYQHSQEIQNQEELSLLCLNETLEDFRPSRKLPSYNSAVNRYSEKSISQLPSIAEKDVQEQPQDEMLFTHQKRLHSNFSTATNYQSKNPKNGKENYINDFDLRLRGGSHEKRLAIDVQSLIKSRSKAKSSMSNHSSKAKNHR